MYTPRPEEKSENEEEIKVDERKGLTGFNTYHLVLYGCAFHFAKDDINTKALMQQIEGHVIKEEIEQAKREAEEGRKGVIRSRNGEELLEITKGKDGTFFAKASERD